MRGDISHRIDIETHAAQAHIAEPVSKSFLHSEILLYVQNAGELGFDIVELTVRTHAIAQSRHRSFECVAFWARTIQMYSYVNKLTFTSRICDVVTLPCPP